MVACLHMHGKVKRFGTMRLIINHILAEFMSLM